LLKRVGVVVVVRVDVLGRIGRHLVGDVGLSAVPESCGRRDLSKSFSDKIRLEGGRLIHLSSWFATLIEVVFIYIKCLRQ
jgi:hypothetical protein